MSDKNVISFFNRRRGKDAELDQASPLEPYHAAVRQSSDKRAWSIRIYFTNGYVQQISYSYRKYEASVSPDRLVIVFTIGAAFLVGKNLRLLLDDLQDERIRSLQPFDPSRHKTPKDGDPVIHTIEWVPMAELKKPDNLAQESVQ